MRTTLFIMAALLVVGASNSEAAQRRDDRRADDRESRDQRDDRWDDRRYDDRDDRRDDRRDGFGRVHGDIHIVFSTGDTRIVREHYRPRYRRLPPGLARKYARTGYLPPGWQRRIEPLPWAVERRLGALPREYRRGVIDDQMIIYAPRTGIIIDATVLF